MRLVVLDAHTLNPGDLSWAPLEALVACDIYERTRLSEVVARCAKADLILSNKTVVNRDHIAALPSLRYIGVLATGYNNIDTGAAGERRIPVCNIPAYGTDSVAQMTFALLLELANRVGHHASTVGQGKWSQCPDFSYTDFPLIELAGLQFGIVGFGRIGQAVAHLALAFGMNVLVSTPRTPVSLQPGITLTSLETLLEQSDVVSLHCPLTDQTRAIINHDRLARMKPSAFLLNTSRGPLVDELALKEALETGRLAGAALDVLSMEPPCASHPLLEVRNCLITPHIAWATTAARARLLRTAIENVAAFLVGKPQNVVNGVAG